MNTRAHELPVSDAKSALAAAMDRIKANRVAGLDVYHFSANRGHYAGAIDSENTRKRGVCAAEAAANPDVDTIERRSFEPDDDIVWRFQFRLGAVLVAQLVDAAMLVDLYRFQNSVPEELLGSRIVEELQRDKKIKQLSAIGLQQRS